MIDGRDALLLFGGILAAVVGRLLWRSVEKWLNGEARLIWFRTHNDSSGMESALHITVDQLLEDAKQVNQEKWASWGFKEIRERFDDPIRSTAVVVYNDGKVNSAEVSILVSQKPQRFSVDPDVPVQFREVANGSYEYLLPPIEPKKQTKATFRGIDFSSVTSVTSSGGEVERYTYSDLIPIAFIKRKKSDWQSRLGNVVVASLALAAVVISIVGIGTNKYAAGGPKLEVQDSRISEKSE
ncbi:hypothetical protein [Aliiroseovarius marinus]|uniref:hypothetical protein n=1 Tax=Aliiroseovarius marinus TaxID=2500159 RepID=UPI00105D937A|nr:hypothetical protein [Aliiroseovarius marinus]